MRSTCRHGSSADELLQDFPQALLVAALGGLDGNAVDRCRELERADVDVVFVVGVVQHAVEADLFDFGDRSDVAGGASVHGNVLLAAQQIQLTDLERLAPVTDEELAVARDRALVHLEHAELAHVRVDRDLENVRHDVLGGIDLERETPPPALPRL